MERHRLQESCLSILYTVALENQNASVDLSERYGTSDILNGVFAALKAHSTSVTVHSSATRLLAWIFTYGRAGYRTLIMDSPCVPAIIKFTHTHADSVELLRSASLFLSALVDAHDAALCCTLVSAGAIEVCLAGGHHPDLELACQTKCTGARLELSQYEQLAPTFRQCGGCAATQSPRYSAPIGATTTADGVPAEGAGSDHDTASHAPDNDAGLFRACGVCHAQYYCSVSCQVCHHDYQLSIV